MPIGKKKTALIDANRKNSTIKRFGFPNDSTDCILRIRSLTFFSTSPISIKCEQHYSSVNTFLFRQIFFQNWEHFSISHVSDFWWFYCPLRFSLNSDCLSVPGKLIDGQVSDVDEVLLVRWKLVIGDLKVCVESFFIVFLHRSRIWRPLLELVRNRISSIWLLFPEESFGYDWMNCQFHNLMTWPHLLVEVISWVLVSVLYGGSSHMFGRKPFWDIFFEVPLSPRFTGPVAFHSALTKFCLDLIFVG